MKVPVAQWTERLTSKQWVNSTNITLFSKHNPTYSDIATITSICGGMLSIFVILMCLSCAYETGFLIILFIPSIAFALFLGFVE